MSLSKFVKRVAVGGYECEACGFYSLKREEVLEHVKTCEYVGYLEAEA